MSAYRHKEDHQSMSTRDWYRPSAQASNCNVACDVFDKAKAKFSSALTHDQDKVALINSHHTLGDVQNAVADAARLYEARKTSPKATKWLQALSKRVKFYGDVMDMLVQHHPEYVSLAWGAMKFLLIAVINHEKTINKLAKALALIADNLPRVQLASILYPTERLTEAVSELYAYILRFLIRALDWYQQGPWKHILHSITHPSELRYDDLIEAISEKSTVVHQLAVSGHQAESREIYDKVIKIDCEIDAKFTEMSSKIDVLGDIMNSQVSALVSTNHQLSDLQFSQIMLSIVDDSICNHIKAFQYLLSTRRRTYRSAQHLMPASFLNSPKLNRWTNSIGSDISIIKGNFRSRQALRNFCVDVIEDLRLSQVPVLWAMKTQSPQETSIPSTMSSIDLIKYLVRQALQLRQNIQIATEKSMSLSCAQFHANLSELDWFQVLASLVSHFPSQIYIVVDLELLDRDLQGFSWLKAFMDLFMQLSDRQIGTRVKVLLVSYGTDIPFTISGSEYSHYVVPAKVDISSRHQGRAKKSGITRFRKQLRFGSKH